eukprot:SAG31_NODE_642_length_13301_cov_14.143084_6_plen_190_part_00
MRVFTFWSCFLFCLQDAGLVGSFESYAKRCGDEQVQADWIQRYYDKERNASAANPLPGYESAYKMPDVVDRYCSQDMSSLMQIAVSCELPSNFFPGIQSSTDFDTMEEFEAWKTIMRPWTNVTKMEEHGCSNLCALAMSSVYPICREWLMSVFLPDEEAEYDPMRLPWQALETLSAVCRESPVDLSCVD